MDRRNTRQKEIVLEIMKKEHTHPTIQQLYQKVKEVDKTIGQATVYRNVAKLCEEGKLKKISIDADYYDYIDSFHNHFYCKKCHQLYDIMLENNFDIKQIEKKNHIQIDEESVLFKGICRKCLDEDVSVYNL